MILWEGLSLWRLHAWSMVLLLVPILGTLGYTFYAFRDIPTGSALRACYAQPPRNAAIPPSQGTGSYLRRDRGPRADPICGEASPCGAYTFGQWFCALC
jgi:hypothetical protein